MSELNAKGSAMCEIKLISAIRLIIFRAAIRYDRTVKAKAQEEILSVGLIYVPPTRSGGNSFMGPARDMRTPSLVGFPAEFEPGRHRRMMVGKPAMGRCSRIQFATSVAR